ncbi:MAG: endoglucanase, partial [Myxococcota bacterium]|nr:endoglucanase [Myxococcota bacterium]
YECYDMSPQIVSDSLAYAFAAYNGASCGTCFQLTFTGKSTVGAADTGSEQLCGKSIIVQVVNTGGLQSGQFDLLIPGGGVGANNACATQWGVSTSALGVQYGGLMLQCEQQNNYNYAQYTACTLSACQSLFAKSPSMAAGCEFLVNWMKGANNPSVKYTQVNCPSQLKSVSGL